MLISASIWSEQHLNACGNIQQVLRKGIGVLTCSECTFTSSLRIARKILSSVHLNTENRNWISFFAVTFVWSNSSLFILTKMLKNVIRWKIAVAVKRKKNCLPLCSRHRVSHLETLLLGGDYIYGLIWLAITRNEEISSQGDWPYPMCSC